MYDREASDLIAAPGLVPSGRNPAPAESDQYNVGARLTVTPTENHDIWFDVDYVDTRYNNEDPPLVTLDLPPTLTANKTNLAFRLTRIRLVIKGRFPPVRLEPSILRPLTEPKVATIPPPA